MCGLTGFYFKRPDRRQISLSAVLEVEMDKRGGDSWGFYGYTYNGKAGITNYDHPVYKRGLGKMIEEVPSRNLKKFAMVMGHTRDATVGAVTVPNAHPFIIGNVVGAHNGAVRNHQELNRKHERECEVDSMHIFAHINENKPLNDIHGYGACTYLYRSHPKRIHLFRWNSGVLTAARVYSKQGERIGVAWASLGSALEDALFASGFEFQLQEIPENKALFVEPDDDEDGIPDIYTMLDYEYKFASAYPSTSTTYATGTEKVFCLKCEVIDGVNFHTNGQHNANGAYKDGKNLKSDLNANYYKDEYKCGVAAILKWSADKTTEGAAFGHEYEVMQVGELMRVLVKGKTSEKDKKDSCDACMGPGPFKHVGRYQLCWTDHQTFRGLSKANKRKFIENLNKQMPPNFSIIENDETEQDWSKYQH